MTVIGASAASPSSAPLDRLANMMRPLLKIGQALAMALLLSCGRDEPLPANVIKTIVVPPRDTAAMSAHRNDSAFVVLRAAAALNKTKEQQVLRLESYLPTDSGTLVIMTAVCPPDYKTICISGGGLVLVDSSGKAKVLGRYRFNRR